jgi:hypothetical protein
MLTALRNAASPALRALDDAARALHAVANEVE